jgi:colicin import membrane protein
MENADKLIQTYEQDKVRRAEQDRIKRDSLERKLKERGAQVKQKQSESTEVAGSAQEVSDSYIGRVRARIKPNVSINSFVEGNPVAEVEVRCSDDGAITSRRVVTSSGNAEWDNAVLRAIDKTEILPRDVDGKVPTALLVKLRLKD